ncbi:uncharacterized protein LOC110746897 [Prunus avium]|uniref:Uncharacterized protein LOC110746897 n=1 Tax=Prunus avium TaxID=42229 RepID=A0A6P5RIK3_PRUAV|nr:uncharacterized protein LOC110746897 [Prunus avium]
MSGEFNGLKTLIMRENEYTYYVHCFAHQLQLAIVGLAKKKQSLIGAFFTLVSNVVNIVGAPSKRRDILRDKQALKVVEALTNGELSSGKGLNQATKIKRSCDTRWGSYYGLVQSFDFVFSLHLMRNILGITNALSQALQRDEQDIVNAMDLVELSRGRSRRNGPKITNMHYYRVDFFYEVIALQLQELNSRFNEANTELLLCLACLSPNDSFSSFDKQKLIRLAQLYPNDFSSQELEVLKDQLQTYIDDMHSNTNFSELQGIAALAKKLVETKKDKAYPLVYLLIKLALTLPVATASVEMAFSAMNIVKNRMRNRMGDQWMNDCLVVYLEKDIFNNIDNELIMQRFQNLKNRRGQL